MHHPPPRVHRLDARSVLSVLGPVQSGGRAALSDWGAWLLLGTAVYIAVFALWQIERWGGARYKMVIGDLAPMPVHAALIVLTVRLAGQPHLRSRQRRAWMLIAAAAVASCMGDTLWAVYELVLGRAPFPSWADVAYFAYYPFLVGGLLMLTGAPVRRGLRGRLALDALTVMLSMALVTWYAVLRPVAAHHNADTLSAVLALAYPVADLGALFGVIWLLLHRPAGLHPRALGLLATGIVSYVTADLAFAYLSLANSYNSGDWPDVAWLLARLLIAAGVQIQIRRPATPRARIRRLAFEGWWPVRLLPYAAVVIVCVLTLVVALGEVGQGLGGLLAGAAALTAFAIARQVLVMSENDRLLLRASALNRRMREREAQYRQMATNASDLLYVLRPGSDSLTWYGRVDELLGYSPGAFPRTVTSWQDHIHPDDRDTVLAHFNRSLETGDLFMLEYRIRRKDGSYATWADRRTPVHDRTGALVRFVGACSDVTEQRAAESALVASEERFRLLVQRASELIVVFDAAGVIQYASPSSMRLLGVRPEAMIGTSILSWLHPDDAAKVERLFRHHLADPNTPQVGGSLRLCHRDGSFRHMDGLATNLLDEPSVQGIVVNMRDVTERQDFETRLAYQAFHDALTGLPNRALFLDRLGHALALHGYRGEQIGVLFLDLDGFKLINDSLGHSAGDTLLMQAGQRLVAALREGDTVARFGGDEFAILLEGVSNPHDALVVAERVLEAFDLPFSVGDRMVSVGTSIGISLSGDEVLSSEDLLRTADIALYRAKAAGKGRYALFDPLMQAGTLTQLDLQAELRDAIQRNQLVLFFQPELDLRTGSLVGSEALVRWQHPVRGPLSPAEFIPLAEETGLILPIGEWALSEACRQARIWHDRYNGLQLTVSVNLSARQFEQPGLVELVARTLHNTGLDPSLLCLEITESMAMANIDASISVCHALKKLGVQVAIDDFGTGYSSLSYLRRFPADVLKIDRTFIAELTAGDETEAIIRAVTTLAHALNMRVTAEGIETAEQEELLTQLACDTGQGFRFSPPLPAAEFERFMARSLPPVAISA